MATTLFIKGFSTLFPLGSDNKVSSKDGTGAVLTVLIVYSPPLNGIFSKLLLSVQFLSKNILLAAMLAALTAML